MCVCSNAPMCMCVCASMCVCVYMCVCLPVCVCTWSVCGFVCVWVGVCMLVHFTDHKEQSDSVTQSIIKELI